MSNDTSLDLELDAEAIRIITRRHHTFSAFRTLDHFRAEAELRRWYREAIYAQDNGYARKARLYMLAARVWERRL